MVSSTLQRIVCLSAEAADWLWRIGAWNEVVGVTAYFDQPPDCPSVPRVSGFSTAQFERIQQLQPDLIITFSDVQRHLAEELRNRGVNVLATDQRTLHETEETLANLSRMVDREAEGERLLKEFRRGLEPVQTRNQRPRVYFEEWNDPLISGIGWVSELIERAGGEDIFSELRSNRAAADRVVTSEQVIAADPDVILASWCGKPVSVETIAMRPGWNQITAVRNGRIHKISSHDILQPGFGLVKGYEQIKSLLDI